MLWNELCVRVLSIAWFGHICWTQSIIEADKIRSTGQKLTHLIPFIADYMNIPRSWITIICLSVKEISGNIENIDVTYSDIGSFIYNYQIIVIARTQI